MARPADAAGGGRGGRGGGAGGAGGAAAPETPPKPVRIDFDKLQQRIVPLPLPARNYLSLVAGRPGIVYLTEPGAPGGGGRGAGGGGGAILNRFDLKTRRAEKLAEGVGAFDLSANGDKMLLRLGGGAAAGRGGRGAAGPPPVPQYVIVAANGPVKAGEGVLRI